MDKLIIIIFISLGFCAVSKAQKNDTIYLLNGDRITGELKKSESAIITLKTNAMKTVSIEVEDVNTIFSNKYFEFRTISGIRYYGSIFPSPDTASVYLITATDTLPKPLWDLAVINQIRNRFFQRIDGSIDLGLSYTKSINVFQYNINAWATYRATHASTRIDISSILSDAGDDDINLNNDIGLNYTRYLQGKWFARVQVDVQQNTELNLQQRIQLGPAGGYDIVRTSPMRLYALVGVLGNREELIDDGSKTTNLEGLLALYYSWDRYHFPKLDISSGFDFYPSLTVSGRIRFEFDASIRYEIFTDIFINLSYYQNFDNKPDAAGLSKNDYGVVTSLGYTF